MIKFYRNASLLLECMVSSLSPDLTQASPLLNPLTHPYLTLSHCILILTSPQLTPESPSQQPIMRSPKCFWG
ncbi:hypothetical protein E2C01_057010 [Portunus trituberculatus]|uniref:Uncharacterized protein n=1 Tax=Portunus trituberculatus TaxID=210409 RepID=A0A5B7GZ86_PORTR|nr:hypothetical protein [Portunus trituberculatus]